MYRGWKKIDISNENMWEWAKNEYNRFRRNFYYSLNPSLNVSDMPCFCLYDAFDATSNFICLFDYLFINIFFVSIATSYLRSRSFFYFYCWKLASELTSVFIVVVIVNWDLKFGWFVIGIKWRKKSN